MSDEEMVILVQTLLHYLKPETTTPAYNDIQQAMQGFKIKSPEYSVAHSPAEGN